MSPNKVKAAPRRKAMSATQAPVSPVLAPGAAGSPEQVLRTFEPGRGEVFPGQPRGVLLPYPEGAWRAIGFLLSLCQPAVGLLLAFLYWPATDGRARRFSRWCLGLALTGLCVLCLLGAVWAALKAGDSGVQPW